MEGLKGPERAVDVNANPADVNANPVEVNANPADVNADIEESAPVDAITAAVEVILLP
jgi:hypothetical protein